MPEPLPRSVLAVGVVEAVDVAPQARAVGQEAADVLRREDARCAPAIGIL